MDTCTLRNAPQTERARIRSLFVTVKGSVAHRKTSSREKNTEKAAKDGGLEKLNKGARQAEGILGQEAEI